MNWIKTRDQLPEKKKLVIGLIKKTGEFKLLRLEDCEELIKGSIAYLDETDYLERLKKLDPAMLEEHNYSINNPFKFIESLEDFGGSPIYEAKDVLYWHYIDNLPLGWREN